jgi:cation:H+ antiporter
MAISNIFGSNAVMAALLFLADAFYRQGPILAEIDSTGRFSLAMGVLLTAIYLVGLVQRRERTLLRMGYDVQIKRTPTGP